MSDFTKWFWGECDILNSTTGIAYRLAEKAWLCKQKEITELKQKLARYENPDYVLVPRNPTREMCILGSKEHAGYGEIDTKSIYKAMIESMGTKND